MSDMFYRDFEDRYRGSFELIQSRLEAYLPFILPLKKFSDKPKALDLGCGRGEWLDLLQKNGFDTLGVDLDEGMLLSCKERGLHTIQSDALQYLKNLESASIDVISAFHVIEHISFEMLRMLTQEANRVLKPGGLLILETPNSENLMVGTSSFYMDPTHHQPIPALLLSFVAEHAKFTRTKILYLQEPVPAHLLDKIGIQNILEGVSCDYSIVSQKTAAPEILALLDNAFSKDYGIRLSQLASKYDQQVKHHIESSDQNIKVLQERTDATLTTLKKHDSKLSTLEQDVRQQLQAQLISVKNSIDEIKQRETLYQQADIALLMKKHQLEKSHMEAAVTKEHYIQLQNQLLNSQHDVEPKLLIEKQKVEHLNIDLNLALEQNTELKSYIQTMQNQLEFANCKISALQEKTQYWWNCADEYKAQVENIINSKKWKVVTLLIFAKKALINPLLYSKKLLSKLCVLSKKAIKKILIISLRIALSRPKIKRAGCIVINQLPKQKEWLRNFAIKSGVMTPEGMIRHTENNGQQSSSPIEEVVNQLSPRASTIYSRLEYMINNKEKVNANNH